MDDKKKKRKDVIMKCLRHEGEVEFKACIHGMSIILSYSFLTWLNDADYMRFSTILIMCLVGYIAGWCQRILFLKEGVYKRNEYRIKSILWCLIPMVIIIAAQFVFKWFENFAWYNALIFDVFMLCYFIFVWVFVNYYYMGDSKELNNMLDEFKKRSCQKQESEDAHKDSAGKDSYGKCN